MQVNLTNLRPRRMNPADKWKCAFDRKQHAKARGNERDSSRVPFYVSAEGQLCHQLIRHTLDIMEKATKIAEIEGMLLDSCGPALCSAV